MFGRYGIHSQVYKRGPYELDGTPKGDVARRTGRHAEDGQVLLRSLIIIALPLALIAIVALFVR